MEAAGIWVGLTRVKRSWFMTEMAVNSYLEDVEGRMRLKRMWKLIPRWEKKEEQMSGGEQ